MEKKIKAFKGRLKDICDSLKKVIDESIANYNEVIDDLHYYSHKKRDVLVDIGIESSNLSYEKMKEILDDCGILISKADEDNIAHIHEGYVDFVKAKRLKDVYDKFRSIIAAFDVDKVKNTVDLSSMLLVCYLLANGFAFEPKFLCVLFGMAVSFNSSKIDKKSLELTEIERITLTLGEYFNSDGTFKYNVDLKTFSKALSTIKDNIVDLDSWPEDLWNAEIIRQFDQLLYASNVAYERTELKTDDVCTIFKDALRRCRREVEEIIDEYDQKICSANQPLSEGDLSVLEKIDLVPSGLPLPNQYNFVLKNFGKRANVTKYTINLEAMEHADGLRDEANAIAQIISAYDINKVKNPVPVFYFMVFMEQMRMFQKTPIEVLCKAFGMAMYTTAIKAPEGDFAKEVKLVASFYNEDGTFVPEKDHSEYFEAVRHLIEKINKEVTLKKEMPPIGYQIAFEFILLHYADRATTEAMEEIPVVQENKVQQFVPTVVDRKAIKQLSKYYANGEIIKVPENMDAFMDILERCLLDDKEITFILNLVNAKIRANRVNADPAEMYLVGEDLNIYKVAKDIHNTLPYTDHDYYPVIEVMKTLNSACELIPNETDEESLAYLQEEKTDAITALREFVGKHIKTEQFTSNNLVFLGSYFADDLAALDKAKQKRVLNSLPRIIKDSQSNFKRLITSENLAYIPYDLVTGGVRISFIEIDSGIYLILGCDTVGDGYRKTVNRVIKENSNISILESQIKDNTRRMELLIEGEKYLTSLMTKAEGRK